jgi:uncharacterized protein
MGNDYGQTPLMDAASEGDVAKVKLLLRHGADVNIVAEGDVTALSAARAAGNSGIASLLIQAGARTSTKGESIAGNRK